jgi:hypothetical protein
MSLKQNDIFEESRYESEQERAYFDSLLKESLTKSRVRRENAINLRRIASVCLGRGYISLSDYTKICEKNDLLIF